MTAVLAALRGLLVRRLRDSGTAIDILLPVAQSFPIADLRTLSFSGRALKWTNLLLILLGAASLVLYVVSLRAKSGDDIEWFIKIALIQSLIYLLAVSIVFRTRSSRSTLVLVIFFAALFRLSILFAPPYLSDDIYRYVWDGRVQATGVNPYRYIPADEALAPLRDQTIYPKINRRDYAHTIYPPGAQIIYFLATRVSERVTWVKTVMLGFEALAIWALLQLLASFNLPATRPAMACWKFILPDSRRPRVREPITKS